MRKTKIIAIEGIDGGGKSLQKDLLTRTLTGWGYTVAEKSFPEYDSFFGRQIGALLKGEPLRADQVDSRSMCLWYALDRWQSFRDFRDGEADFLLLNRYVASNAVYQSVREIDLGMEDNWEWVHSLEHGQLGLPEPDLYLLLDVDPDAAQKNVDKKGERQYIGEGKRDVYEAQAGLLRRARARYLSIAQRQPEFAIISCMENGRLDSPQAIASRMIGELVRRGLVRPKRSPQ